jgi:hypothetical protein
MLTKNNCEKNYNESELIALDEYILKKLKLQIRNSPLEFENFSDIGECKAVLRAHADFYREARSKEIQFVVEEVNEKNLNLLMEKGIGKVKAKDMFDSNLFSILKKEVRDYVIHQTPEFMFGGLHNNNYNSTTFKLNLTNPLKINAKALYEKWEPKLFLTIHTMHFLEYAEEKINSLFNNNYQLIKATLMISTRDDNYYNQHFSCLLPMNFRGLKKLGDSVIICIIPVDGLEDARIHAIPLSHHYENYGELDETSSVTLSIEEKTILLMNGLFVNAESSYSNLNYRLKLILCRKELSKKLVSKKFVDYINTDSLYFPEELIRKAKEEYLIVSSSPYGCEIRKKKKSFITPEVLDEDEDNRNKKARLFSNDDEHHHSMMLDELVSNDDEILSNIETSSALDNILDKSVSNDYDISNIIETSAAFDTALDEKEDNSHTVKTSSELSCTHDSEVLSIQEEGTNDSTKRKEDQNLSSIFSNFFNNWFK